MSIPHPNGLQDPAPPARLPGLSRPRWIPPVPDRRWLPPSWGDVLLAAFLAVTGAISAVVAYEMFHEAPLPVELAIGLVPALAIGLRRRYPIAVLVVAMAAWVAAAPVRGPTNGSLAALIALYTIGTLRPWPVAAEAWVAATVVGFAADTLSTHAQLEPLAIVAALVAQCAISGFATATGLYMGTRRAYFDGLVERAQRLERERELVARQAVADERVRIARELHDVVAHHVSVMVIQAGAAEAVLPAGADESAAALEAVRTTGREALGEMRRMLEVLRADEGPGAVADGGPAASGEGAEPASAVKRTPQPGLRDLPALAARMREAGLDVELALDGAPWALPATVDLSAFRIVQEALTNALRHAGPGVHVHVRGRCEAGEVEIEVADDGRGRAAAPPAQGGGHGLVGMRERVALFGGRFSAGPGPAGGYRVRFTLPIGGASR